MGNTTLTDEQWAAFEDVLRLARSHATTEQEREHCDMFEDFLVNECEEQDDTETQT